MGGSAGGMSEAVIGRRVRCGREDLELAAAAE